MAGNKSFTAVAGTKANAPDFNNNVYMPLLDLNTTDQAEATTTSTSYADAKSLSVSADGITKDVIVKFIMFAAGSLGTGFVNITTSVDVQLDAVSQDIFIVASTVSSTTNENQAHRTIAYRITPSGAQIAAGFTIKLRHKISSTSGTGGLGGIRGWYVEGT